MKILLPVAGVTPFFPPDEYPFPKPLVEIRGKPMIAWAVENLRLLDDDAKFVFIAMQEEAVRHSYENIFKLVAGPGAETVTLRARTAGALCSCLMACEKIDPDEPLVIANYDQIIEGALDTLIAKFRAAEADAGVLTFDATHPRWSYVRVEDGFAVEASEKRVISRNAIAGIYWFARGADFLDAAKKSIRAHDKVGDDYYVAPSLNHLVLAGRKVAVVEMDREAQLHSFYLPSGIQTFEARLQSRETAGAAKAAADAPVNVVIPAAGEGSRFAKAGYKAPKPFIDVLGRPMITHVMDNVAVRHARTTVLLRSDHLGFYPEAEMKRRGAEIVEVETLTEGTACTVLLARARFDDDCPLLIANSDQLVDFDCQDFVDDARHRGLDGSILVFRDSHRDPKWSFARINDRGLVVEVAEKKPISDLATVGIYFFAKGSEFISAAIDMIARNDRVNGEFYTCPAYNYMIANGARVGVYEVAETAMDGLGIPDDLDRYLRKIGGPGARSAHAPDAA